MKYLRENDEATIKFYQGNAFLVEAPNFVDLKVIETEPGVKGRYSYKRNKGCYG